MQSEKRTRERSSRALFSESYPAMVAGSRDLPGPDVRADCKVWQQNELALLDAADDHRTAGKEGIVTPGPVEAGAVVGRVNVEEAHLRGRGLDDV